MCDSKTSWLALLVVIVGAGLFYFTTVKKPQVSAMQANMELRQTLRKLWTDHVVWTRQYIVSTLADLPDQKAATARLLKNQEDLARGLAPFLADGKLAEDIEKLLKEHILIAADIVAAAKVGDKMKVDEKNALWLKNADDIATSISNGIPALKKDDLVMMLQEHLTLTTAEVMARLNQKWEEDVATFENIFNQSLAMADALASGIEGAAAKK